MSKKGLLTPSEVVKYTPVAIDFNPCSFRELYRIEYAEAVRFIGLGLWQSMVDALADYSALGEYQAGQSYAADDVVLWRRSYRRAKADTSKTPDHSTDWEDAPKFTGDCAAAYDDLYCSFLAPYLAHVALQDRLPYIITRITDQGMTYGGRKYNAQDDALLKQLKAQLARDTNRAGTILVQYLSDQEGDCFAGWLGAADDDCTPDEEPQPRPSGRFLIG